MIRTVCHGVGSVVSRGTVFDHLDINNKGLGQK